MISSTYAKAYTEVLEIIKYFPEEEYSKIPEEKIKFYKDNRDTNYNFTINPEIDLSKQNVSKQASAIMVNLFIDYFANEEQKIIINDILDLNQKKIEQEKSKKYNTENIFKNTNGNKNLKIELPENHPNTALIEYKETFFTKFKNFIFKLFHITR